MVVLTGPGEAGCFRQVAALYSDTIDSSTTSYAITVKDNIQSSAMDLTQNVTTSKHYIVT